MPNPSGESPGQPQAWWIAGLASAGVAAALAIAALLTGRGLPSKACEITDAQEASADHYLALLKLAAAAGAIAMVANLSAMTTDAARKRSYAVLASVASVITLATGFAWYGFLRC